MTAPLSATIRTSERRRPMVGRASAQRADRAAERTAGPVRSWHRGDGGCWLVRLGWTRWPHQHEVLIALGATVVMVGASFGANARVDAPRRLDVLGVLLVVLAGACLAWLRAAPIPAIGVAAAIVTWYLVLGYPYGPIQISVIVLMVAVARTRPLRTSGLVCLVVAIAATVAVLSRLVDDAVPRAVVVIVWVSWLVIPWLLGSVLRMRAEASARTREELVAIATARERTRVAGEVHDIAGHGFAVIAMQAGVALISLEDDPEQARSSLEAIQSVSGRGLADLRSMLGTFHPSAGGRPAPPLAPPPAARDTHGLDELHALLDEVGSGALSVTEHIDDLGPLAPEIGHVVYRVVQESLTNVVKHAHADSAEVSLHRDGETIVVRVVDTGVGGDFTAGSGLTGMGQRVGAVGGRFKAAPRRERGFEVEAVIPLRNRGGADDEVVTGGD